MNRIICCFIAVSLSCTICAQTQSISNTENLKELKAYALLDLGFSGKLLHLNTDGAKTLVKKEEVKKSPRSLEEILGKSKKENLEKSKKENDAAYHLIAGCFSSINNANRLVSTLNDQGYPSKLIGENERGLHMVTYQSYSTKAEAVKELKALSSEGMSTWIKKQ